MQLTVIGIGYVGLVSAVGLAARGHKVICLVRDQKKLAKLRRGQIPIYEPGLGNLSKRAIKQGKLTFTTDKAAAIQASRLIMIAVGTPQDHRGQADLSAIWAVGKDIAKFIRHHSTIVIKSTVPVGTNHKLQAKLNNALKGKKVTFDIASNPEFLREGLAVKDFLEPDRVVIGVGNSRTGRVMRQLYNWLPNPKQQIYLTDIRSAELIKYASNNFLATKITYINEIANYCELVGADVEAVAVGMGLDLRIGPKFLKAGIGYGGSCFPKDVSALIESGRQSGYTFSILRAVKKTNAQQRLRLVSKLKKHLGSLKNKKIAIWGVSFKPDTDDIREAPAITIANKIVQHGGRVTVYDPIAMPNAKRELDRRVSFSQTAQAAAKQADALLIVTEWTQFKKTKWPQLKKQMKQPLVIDGRNMFEPKLMAKHGIEYYSIGRP